MDKFNYLKEQLTAALATWQQTNGGKTTVGWMHAANPEVIAALLAELEAKDKRIAELEEEFAFIMGQNDGMEKELRDKDARIEHLEAKLATPVRLPPPAAWMRGDDKTTFGPIFTKNKDYAESQWGDSAIALYSVPVGIKEVAFSDERNLMHINERGRETSLIWSKNNSENGDIQLFRLVGFTVDGDE
ncbi:MULTISPECIES: ead/Ea22-like family protein [unclassified Serratia (in: enterobacteria)]|uniref:ead/Ea22-like family protein n=1 Tax=unclassified Serratia (in: enterobacteria) TaxID=2647522 RepID=UPI001C716777|nr:MULTISPECIES: ead/Ea22-like family protein [unclassified Serratia (in: enterobacteria)]